MDYPFKMDSTQQVMPEWDAARRKRFMEDPGAPKFDEPAEILYNTSLELSQAPDGPDYAFVTIKPKAPIDERAERASAEQWVKDKKVAEPDLLRLHLRTGVLEVRTILAVNLGQRRQGLRHEIIRHVLLSKIANTVVSVYSEPRSIYDNTRGYHDGEWLTGVRLLYQDSDIPLQDGRGAPERVYLDSVDAVAINHALWSLEQTAEVCHGLRGLEAITLYTVVVLLDDRNPWREMLGTILHEKRLEPAAVICADVTRDAPANSSSRDVHSPKLEALLRHIDYYAAYPWIAEEHRSENGQDVIVPAIWIYIRKT
ncbi:hypothetical protein BDV95DRAFT_587874 [Massariosphaeria phaeospora]|uniref:Uncharacterized protein n=1 Tax=Massariosphaeria phaeospora TaxID=100035 RepID=A0A7C8M171_9PLEO|nr:hypothetical protein BDV95DRAFT_587874 [Massariosphaeria phaeospora]